MSSILLGRPHHKPEQSQPPPASECRMPRQTSIPWSSSIIHSAKYSDASLVGSRAHPIIAPAHNLDVVDVDAGFPSVRSKVSCDSHDIVLRTPLDTALMDIELSLTVPQGLMICQQISQCPSPPMNLPTKAPISSQFFNSFEIACRREASSSEFFGFRRYLLGRSQSPCGPAGPGSVQQIIFFKHRSSIVSSGLGKDHPGKARYGKASVSVSAGTG